MKRAVLVNGVPASGKSTVARTISQGLGWPLLALDTIKEAHFAHLGTGDRDYNRQLGKASYQAIFSLIGEFPEGTGVVIDAWFGFQPIDVLQAHIERAGLTQIVEVWCHAPPAVIGERYLERTKHRSTGHLGPDYVPELVALAARATSTGLFPVIDIETSLPNWSAGLVEQLKASLMK